MLALVMSQPLVHRLCAAGFVRFVLILVAVCLIFHIVGRHSSSRQGLQRRRAYDLHWCRRCSCDCFPEPNSISLPPDILNKSVSVYADCAKNDPEMNEEITKNMITLLSEEINMRKNVSGDVLEYTQESIMAANEINLRYQKEAEKCHTGVQTCERGRERAEAELVEERRLSALWERRAREFGWEDDWRDGGN